MKKKWWRTDQEGKAKKGIRNLCGSFERVVELGDDLRRVHGQDHELPNQRGGGKRAQVQLLLVGV